MGTFLVLRGDDAKIQKNLYRFNLAVKSVVELQNGEQFLAHSFGGVWIGEAPVK